MSRRIKMLFLEDNPKLLKQHTRWLTSCGFQVFAAASTNQADTVLETVGDLDVALLDMNLGPNSSMSGAQYVMALRERKFKSNPPECLVFSGEDHYSYYQQAIRLGAAAYMRKNEENAYGSIDLPLRALALRKELRCERQPLVLQRLRSIALSAGHQGEALARFSQEVLGSELNRILANPFYLLISTLKGSECHTGEGQRTVGPHVDEVVARIKPEGVTRLNNTGLPTGADWGDHWGTSFINLYQGRSIKISLGLVGFEKAPDAYFVANDRDILAEALLEFVKPVFFSSLENLAVIMTEHDDAYLDGLSNSCAWFSRRLALIQQQVGDRANHSQISASLDALAEELRYRGESGKAILAVDDSLELQNWEDSLPEVLDDPIEHEVSLSADNIKGIVSAVWREVVGHQEGLLWSGENFTPEDRELLWQCVYRMVQWMTLRARNSDTSLEISVTCSLKNGAELLTFEDCSVRCNELQREGLFQSFSPFHIGGLHFYDLRERIKRKDGFFEDQTDQLDGPFGHRFQLCLPQHDTSLVGSQFGPY